MEAINISSLIPSLGFSLVFLWLWTNDKKEAKERELEAARDRKLAESKNDELSRLLLSKFEENAKVNQQVAGIIENNTKATENNTRTAEQFIQIVDGIISNGNTTTRHS